MKSEQKNINDTRIAILEINNNHFSEFLQRIERQLEKIDTRFNKLEEKIENGLDKINNRIWSNFYWILGAITGLGLLMAHGFKWF
jgi:predicted nuclease with TOPRIM domain